MQVLVNGLANSRTFQRFAIRSNAALSDLAKKTADNQNQLSSQVSEFSKAFREEMKKGLDDIAKKR